MDVAERSAGSGKTCRSRVATSHPPRPGIELVFGSSLADRRSHLFQNTLHVGGEFAESNLGTAVEADGSVTARVIGEQYSFVPDCVRVPVDTPVKFRLTGADVIHGFLIPSTNINTMVVPGFIAEVRTTFTRSGAYWMPCDEFCGDGHHGMWARVNVVPKDQFPKLASTERTSCAKQ